MNTNREVLGSDDEEPLRTESSLGFVALGVLRKSSRDSNAAILAGQVLNARLMRFRNRSQMHESTYRCRP